MMRPQRLLLLVITALLIAGGWIMFNSQTAKSLFSQNRDLIGFFIAVAFIALLLWFFRSVVESQPDPFFLNLTFYACAGQCIKTGEAIATQTATAGRLSLLLLPALFLLWMEVFVTKTHEKVTIKHYKKQLEKAQKERCTPGEIDRWAKLLVKISGTDFSPGSYSWLTFVFEGEPKEESKKQARSILDGTQFDKDSEFLTPDGLTVSPPEQKRYWLPYILIPVGSWFVFGWALFASR